MEFDADLFNEALELEESTPARPRRVTAAAPVARATVTTRPRVASAGHLSRPPESWTWSDVRDYVVAKIIELHGQFPRNEGKEFGIFSSFYGRYEGDSARIARYAMEGQPQPGFWLGAPISINRFTKNSDPSFGDVILARLDKD